MLSPAHEGLKGRPLPGCLLFPPLHSSVAETAEGAVGSATILLVDPATFGGHGSSMQLALASRLCPPALRPPSSPSCCPAAGSLPRGPETP